MRSNKAKRWYDDAMPGHNSESVLTEGPRLATNKMEKTVDVYFSADVETDGSIPGPFSMLSFALVYAGNFDGQRFTRPNKYDNHFYAELKPISNNFDPEALRVNGIDRARLIREGRSPLSAMKEASEWVWRIAGDGKPVLVAYPLSFDWSWLYWYFIRFAPEGSPFNYSRCFDIKTAFAIKAHVPIADAGRSRLESSLRPRHNHTHHALDDAIEQAEIFANVFQWEGKSGGIT
jgi:3' exoribonuclease, RNase T-like